MPVIPVWDNTWVSKSSTLLFYIEIKPFLPLSFFGKAYLTQITCNKVMLVANHWWAHCKQNCSGRQSDTSLEVPAPLYRATQLWELPALQQEECRTFQISSKAKLFSDAFLFKVSREVCSDLLFLVSQHWSNDRNQTLLRWPGKGVWMRLISAVTLLRLLIMLQP